MPVDRYRDRSEIEGCVLEMDENAHWQPAETHSRLLAPSELEKFREVVEVGFWRISITDVAPRVMDGESWYILGYRRGTPPSLEFCGGGTFRELERHTGSLIAGTGADAFSLGRWMATCAGMLRFEDS